MSTKVWYTNEGFFDPDTRTYIVAEVTPHERGYDVHSRWGTIEAATAEARRLNIEAGVPLNDVVAVVASSMAAGRKPPAGPLVELMTTWDPDGGGSTRVFIDGVEVQPFVEEWVDPARGYEWADWSAHIEEVREAGYSPAFKDALLPALEAASDSEYIIGKPQEVHCANCGEVVEPDDGGAIWYHRDSMEMPCDPEGEQSRDRMADPGVR